MMNKYIIDAKDRVPGRVATEVAVLLMGKDRTDFARNRIPDILVEVLSTSEMRFSAKKLRDKILPNTNITPVDKEEDLIGLAVGRVKTLIPTEKKPASLFYK